MSSKPSGFLEYLCASYPQILTLHYLLWVGLVVNTTFVVFGDLPPGATVVTGLNYAGIIALLLGSGAVLLKCRDK